MLIFSSDILFLVALTSTVFIFSEFKKLFERRLETRLRSIKSDLDFVWHPIFSSGKAGRQD